MNKLLHRLLAAVLVLASLVLVSPATAQAQSWLPSFDRDNYVYVEPSLKNHASYPVDFGSMPRELAALAARHKLAVYVVALERDFPQDQVIAKEIANDLVARWQSLPKDDFLLIVWVRQKFNPNKGSVAAYAGNRLLAYGFTPAHMSDKVNGPVTPALRRFMPQDPGEAILQVVRNVNQGVDARIEAEKRAEEDRIEAEKRAAQERIDAAQRAEQERIENEKRVREAELRKRQIVSTLSWAAPTLAFIGLALFLTLRFKRSRARALAALEKMRGELQNAGHWYTQLEEAYLGFLKRQTDWQKRFDPKGRTAKQFAEAVGWYANLTTRNLAANEMFERAEKAFNSTRFPLTGGFEKAIAILSSEEVTVSDRNLSIEEAELFKGLVSETKYAPAELLANMEELFSKTNKALAEIKRAFEGTAQNRQDIANLLSQVEELKGKLAELGLTFEPYKGRFAQISADRDAILAVIDKDPLSAFSGSEEVEAAAGELKSDIEHAIKLHANLAEVEKELCQAGTRVAEIRAREVDYIYPEKDGGEGEKPVAENFLLLEEGESPDDELAEAKLKLEEARKALLAGKLELAESLKSASSKASAEALAVLDKVLAAKSFTEKNLLACRAIQKKLDSELPGAESNIKTLKSEFLAANFAGEAEKLAASHVVSKKTDAELAKVKMAYFKQNFVAARRILEAISSEISGARVKLAEIASRLSKLKELKAQAKKVVADCGELSASLASKLAANAFSTSKQTDEDYARLLPAYKKQKADVEKQVTDWPAASAEADSLLASFKKVDAALDAERQAYELTGKRIAELKQHVDAAATAVANPDTREPARQKLGEARSALASVEAAYKVAKSDWVALAAKCESEKSRADEAGKLAAADKRLAGQARTQIDAVEGRIRSLTIRSFTQTVSWGGYSQVIGLAAGLDLSEANRYLGQATSELRNRDYEGAVSAASRADNACDSAEAWANAQLAAMAQELMARWQAEERRKEEERREEERRHREEENRRRREEEEDDRRRRNDNNNNGGGHDYGGGGSNYDSGGGGSNYDAGGGGGGAGGDNY